MNFRINECDASLIGEALEKLTETNPEEGIVSDAERIYSELQNQMKNQSALTIEELSRRFLINPTSLKKAFRQRYGMSIAAHTQHHRMEKAAALLQQTQLTVAEIARAVGFQSQSRFTAVFKDHFGLLPTDCRRPGTLPPQQPVP